MSDSLSSSFNSLIDGDSIVSPDGNDVVNEGIGEVRDSFNEFKEDNIFDLISGLTEKNLFENLDNYFPSGGGSCVVYDFQIFTFDICRAADKVRPILFYVFAMLTLLYLRNLFFRTAAPRG
ncbi:hypothetical protein [Shewanella algae]|uniref:hypothetical protein n=1 Tax=Shewanella algae TaxID=38313 RepID=UPI0030041BC0